MHAFDLRVHARVRVDGRGLFSLFSVFSVGSCVPTCPLMLLLRLQDKEIEAKNSLIDELQRQLAEARKASSTPKPPGMARPDTLSPSDGHTKKRSGLFSRMQSKQGTDSK